MKKKKIVCVLSTLSLFFLFGIDRIYSEESDKVELKLSEIKANQGDEFETSLYVEEDSNMCDFQISFTYDTDFVELIEAIESDNAGGDITINSENTGEVIINYTRNTNITTEKKFVDFKFKVNENAGTGDYQLLSINEDYRNKAGRLVNDILIEVPLECNFDNVIIHSMGDIDLSGEVDIFDVTHLRRHLAFLETLTDYQLMFADGYYDHIIDIFDASWIQRHLARYDAKLGNRYDINFFDLDGNLYARRSVESQNNLNNIPKVPNAEEYTDGVWSLDKDKEVTPNFNDVRNDINVYALYKTRISKAMQFYKQYMNTMYLTGQKETELTNDIRLIDTIEYEGDYKAKIIWSSSNNEILNDADGKFKRPDYDSTVTLTATITGYKGNFIDDACVMNFTYKVPGKYKAASKEEVAQYLRTLFVDGIDSNLKLPRKVTNSEVNYENEFELRIDWEISDNGQYKPISEIQRTTLSQKIDLVANVTFNGAPLEDDGKIYFDDVDITAITSDEVKEFVITKIAAGMGVELNDGDILWNESKLASDENIYGIHVTWQSDNIDILSINNYAVSISDSAINGVTAPITATVTYENGDNNNPIILNYTITVHTNNQTLVPGVNMNEALYDALKTETKTKGDLTTNVLKNKNLVYLDLTAYPEITDLSGLTYCENLRVLNISGLKIKNGLNEISTLTNLEALIAKGCDLDTLTYGNVPVLKNMIKLKMLDLSYNNLTSLDSILASDVRYGKLSELYLNDNNINDISRISNAPFVQLLALSNNDIDSNDLQYISDFEYISYLSLAGNNIDDISYLKNLTSLQQLRLQYNNISDVRNLSRLTNLEALYLGYNNISTGCDFLDTLAKLQVLYIDHNNIEDISFVSGFTDLKAINFSYNKIDGLPANMFNNSKENIEEIYAEGNRIASSLFVKNLTNLRILMFGDNGDIEDNDIGKNLSALTNLEVLTLSNKPINDLSFLNEMPKISILDLHNCNLPSYLPTEYSVEKNDDKTMLTITNYVDNIANIVSKKETLSYLDISNNNLEYQLEEVLRYVGINPDEYDYLNISSNPTNIELLRNLSELSVLFADNINKTLDAEKLTQLMSNLRLISLENCGINNMQWLAKQKNLSFVDLANNNISDVNIGNYISNKSKGTLAYLYLDSNNPDAKFANAYTSYDENNLRELSLEGIRIEDTSELPYMDKLNYLNISDTGIKSIKGNREDFYDVQSIARFTNLEKVDISHNDVDISELTSLDKLKTLYCESSIETKPFYKQSLYAIYNLVSNKNVDVRLYDINDTLVCNGEVEGNNILSQLEELPSDLWIAADGKISSNNPTLTSVINDYDISWSLSNNDNYEIIDNKLSIKSYDCIEDEQLNVYATIEPYNNGVKATRAFEINMHILRANIQYINYIDDGYSENLKRNDSFEYRIELKENENEHFDCEVKPVEDYISYQYSSKLSDGTPVDSSNVISIDDEIISINNQAPLSSSTEISISIGHYQESGESNPIEDKVISTSFKIVENTYTITYVTNGGVVETPDGRSITSQNLPEESELFADIKVYRKGYLFKGWFYDEQLQNHFELTEMPSEDVTIYASWEANTYNLIYDPNGGTVDRESDEKLVDTPIGDLPVPTRDYHYFDGWYTLPVGGEEVTATTSYLTTDDVIIYAHWTEKEVSGWTSANSLPTGAKVVDRKWTYTEKETIKSTNESMEGYTLVGSTWIKSGNGSKRYASFPDGYNTNDQYYQSISYGPYETYETNTNKRTVSNELDSYIFWHWCYKTTTGHEGNRYIESHQGYGQAGYYYGEWEAFNLSDPGTYTENAGWRSDYTTGVYSYWYYRIIVYKSTYTDYYKEFEYMRRVDKESSTPVSESSTISNVKEMVRYIEK